MQTFIQNIPNYVYASFARNPKTPVDLLAKLSTSDNEEVRLAVTKHPYIPTSLLATMATDPNDKVRASIARNKRTPQPILTQFAHEINDKIRFALHQNPHAPFWFIALEFMTNSPAFSKKHPVFQHHRRRLSLMKLDYMLKHDKITHLNIIPHLLTIPNLPNDLLEIIAHGNDWANRARVARYPSVPRYLLRELSHDGNRYVRLIARQALQKKGKKRQQQD